MHPSTGSACPELVEGQGTPPTKLDVERVFVAHYDAVYRFLLRLVHDTAEAEDLTQETFARAYEALPRFRGEATLKTWLIRIAQNIALDRFRRLSRQRPAAGVPHGHPTAAAAVGTPSWNGDTKWLDDGDVEALPAQALDQAQAAEQRQSNACVQRCVDALADDYKQAVVLHDMVGMTNGEIAKMLGVSLATVKIRVHRGRQRMKELAGRYCEVYRDERNELACQIKRERERQ